MTYNPCLLIPIYNHHKFIEQTLINLLPYKQRIILIDDGSNEECRVLLEKLTKKEDAIHLLRLKKNKGKGAAVIAGLKEAFGKEFTHALQIDADGQHDFHDVPRFLEYAKSHPDTIVSGYPIYDKSIPKIRLYGRYITHFWVCIETLSCDIKDSMCGFRMYPLIPTINLLKKAAVGQRMDFDTDILVQLYWQCVPIHFIETQVIYPLDGLSHFHSIKDNLRITRMHTFLFLGMLKRFPSLLKRKLYK